MLSAIRAGNIAVWGGGGNMSYRKALLKLAAVVGVLAIVALAIASGPAALATFTRYFCSAAVGVFAVASTLGLATRLRA
jgi:hypothetical protein